MWIRKNERDHKKGVDSPFPTQVVSNEEFIPRPQNERQKKMETLIGEMSAEKSKKLGMDRRSFMASSMGLATCCLASNKVYGQVFDVDEAETFEPQATAEKWPKDEYFVIDVQSHFTNGIPLGFRSMEFVKNMGFNLKEDAESYSFPNFVKEMFYDSDTNMVIISGVPGREINKDKDGKVLEGVARTPGRNVSAVLPSWLMSQAKKQINDLAGGTQRALCTRRPRSNRWNARFTSMVSTPGNGIATTIQPHLAAVSSATTTTRNGSLRSRANAGSS